MTNELGNNYANLYTNVKDFKQSFKFMTYNVDCAVREEQFPTTKWCNRYKRIINLVKDAEADIVCLQEMRKLDNKISVNKFLSEFDGYNFELGYRNASMLSFGQATLYDLTKFYPLKTEKYWLSDTPNKMSDTFTEKNGFGYLVLATQFAFVASGKIVENSQPF